MHEWSLARTLWGEVQRVWHRNGAARVVAVRLEVGELAGVEPESLRAAFELVAGAAGAGPVRLELELTPLEARCETCGLLARVARFRFLCPACRGRRLTVLRGEGLILREVTLETGDE